MGKHNPWLAVTHLELLFSASEEVLLHILMAETLHVVVGGVSVEISAPQSVHGSA